MVDLSKDGDGTLSQPSEVGAGETLRSSFASKIRNVDGKILGKDEKPMRRAIRQEHVRVSDQIDSDHVDNHSTSSIPANGGSFASILQSKTSKKVVKVSELRNNEKFSTREGMEKVIENGPWLIRSVPLILNVWTPNAQVKKDEIKVVPVWVKLRHVPVVAYSEIGLRQSLETVVVEYEWTPPRCGTCCIFDHTDDQCPIKPIEVVTVNEEKDGFVEVKKKKKSKATKNSKQISGVRLSKPVYKKKEVVTKNSFDALVDDDTMGMSDETNWIHAKHSLNVTNESDSEEVDQVIELGQPMNMRREQTKGASTPEGHVSDV
ncbi:zinc knuckle CX2CX4HX4C containing protein [Tanacetum coccineum]